MPPDVLPSTLHPGIMLDTRMLNTDQ